MKPIHISRAFSKQSLCATALVLAAFVLSAWSSVPSNVGAIPEGFRKSEVEVNGTRLHYVIGGKGSPVLLLHGYAETSHMWNPLLPLLAKNHTVIAPDLRGAGNSSKPESGYDKKNMAVDIHDLVKSLGFNHASVVGHDIGLMVAYAYAAQFPQETDRVVLMDAFLPGIGDWKSVWLMRDLWHFHFYGDVPLALVKGRERIYLEHFWNDFAADSRHSVLENDRRLYAKSYAKPGSMRAGFEWFRNFEQDAKDFGQFSATKLRMPVFVLTGEKASGEGLIEQAKLVASNVRGQIVMGSGHWLMEEAPQIVIPAITAFLNEAPPNSGLRLTDREIRDLPQIEAPAGTSGVAGIQTRILVGNPKQHGPYTIQLSVPSNTRIEAHSHPDERTATVISGSWSFGYGRRFDGKELKELPPGSFYTEPSNVFHFAHTGIEPAVVQISGIGPTGTLYEEQTAMDQR
jgi:pimeloyl-ACP methyl ester carboxylesterase/quercetin dioxygenase-like cupin family protein